MSVFVRADYPSSDVKLAPRSEGNYVKTVQDDSIVNPQIKELHLSSICRRTWLWGNVTVLKPADRFCAGFFKKINPTPPKSFLMDARARMKGLG